jgi:hypothetical protein
MQQNEILLKMLVQTQIPNVTELRQVVSYILYIRKEGWTDMATPYALFFLHFVQLACSNRTK